VASQETEIAIVGGGIVGLALALSLHQRGLACRVYEAAPDIRELGVGITLLPHAMRELTALGLGPVIESIGIENSESKFYNRFGQHIFSEPRGRHAGYAHPEIGLHRGKLHGLLYRTALERLGADRVITDRTFISLHQDDTGVDLTFRAGDGGAQTVRAAIAIACDGVNSAVRRQFYPNDDVVFTGINTWRGVTVRRPILDGRTYLRIGSIRTGKIVIYPIIDQIDEEGRQLINWIAEIESDRRQKNDWNKPGRLEDFLPIYDNWRFDWLDVGELIRTASSVLEYPMVDKDPIERWTFGRVTFAGDAAHPMYPRGSNGSAQGLIDARTLADALADAADMRDALEKYARVRAPATAAVVRTNRSSPPDVINMRVEELTGDRPFSDLSQHISPDELRALSDQYKRIAGFMPDETA
jgi:2-polyprenyl-6-methoxyphenol hydroxylase-like FAD-dependent oxidoreductase